MTNDKKSGGNRNVSTAGNHRFALFELGFLGFRGWAGFLPRLYR
jgi:hypothetical protein